MCLRIPIPRLPVKRSPAGFLWSPRETLGSARFVVDFYDLSGGFTLSFWAPVTPLLEMEGDRVGLALIAERPDPVRVSRTGFTAALAAGNDPADLRLLEPWCQVNSGEQRLAGQKPHMRIDANQPLDAPGRPALVLSSR